jgi:glucokinase
MQSVDFFKATLDRCSDSVTLLAGDVGGTKTDLALFSPECGIRAPIAEATLPSAEYPSLETLVQEFLGRARIPVSAACFGVAGPVTNGQARITNLPWVIEEGRLREALRLTSVRLLNDLAAIAHAVPMLQPADLDTLRAGRAVSGGAIAVVAPGTGLGETFLTWDGMEYRAHPSEGGHADFAPTTALELDMLQHLQRQFEHVSYERVCSGRGLPNIYTYLKAAGYAEETGWLADELAAAADPTPIIIRGALGDRPCRLCRLTLDTFASILAAEAGNLALKVLATGGVYIGGGLPRRILPVLKGGPFLQTFGRKGRLAGVLHPVPVHVILNPKVGLVGAAVFGLRGAHALSRPVEAR